MTWKKTELYLKDVIRGRRRGLIPSLIKAVLLPLSWCYGWGVALRNYLYEQGWLRRYVPPVPLVISVGNIVAGGTGKTPVTLLLAGAFYERYTLAILSRGYRSKAEKLETPLFLSEGDGPTLPASYCGDEPYLLAQRLPKAFVIVGGNRKKASFLAAKAGAQVILLDDAMQHRRLVRDFDVVVVDGADPFGHGYLLPRGFLREDVRALARANLIIVNHIQDFEQFAAVTLQLKPYTAAPFVGTRGYVAAIRNLQGKEMVPTEKRTVAMFCGIAQPESFRRTLEREGFSVVHEYALADHVAIPATELERFAEESLRKGAEWLMCTEKDRVKLPEILSLSLPVVWVQLELRVVAGEEEWRHFLEQTEAKIK